MEIKEITEAIELASKGLKDGVDGAKQKAQEALTKAAELISQLEAKASKDDLTKAMQDQKSALETAIKELQDQHNALSTKVNEAKVENNEEKPKSFVDALKEGLKVKKAEIDEMVAKGGKNCAPIRIDLKAAVTMGDFNTIEAVGSASHYTLTRNTGIISALRKRILTYLGAVSVDQNLSNTEPYAMWIEELDEQGTPIFLNPETTQKTQLSVRYEEREKRARTIAVWGKVTMRMLRNLPQLISYIQNNLIKRMDIATEDGLFNGNDTGENLAGLIPYATAFNGGSGPGGAGVAGQVEAANEYDVIRAAVLQVNNNFGAGDISFFVSYDTIAKMDLAKDSEDRYLLPPFRSATGNMISGATLIPTNALTGTGVDFVGGDLSVVHVAFTENAAIQIGLDGNDFTNNKKTILVEQELVQFVSANDTQVLVKGSFATAKAILETT